jgi:hypothetical protein
MPRIHLQIQILTQPDSFQTYRDSKINTEKTNNNKRDTLAKRQD